MLTRVVAGLRHLRTTLRLQRDRRLHGGRHRRAKLRLRHTARPRHILIVCRGNICRSPYLEAALRRLRPDIEISSAGFIGPGRSVPSNGATVASRRGLDLSEHRSKQLVPDILRRVDLVIVMDGNQARYVANRLRFPPERVLIAGDLDPQADSREIRDPWNQPLEVFESSYARLDRCAAILAESLRRS